MKKKIAAIATAVTMFCAAPAAADIVDQGPYTITGHGINSTGTTFNFDITADADGNFTGYASFFNMDFTGSNRDRQGDVVCVRKGATFAWFGIRDYIESKGRYGYRLFYIQDGRRDRLTGTGSVLWKAPPADTCGKSSYRTPWHNVKSGSITLSPPVGL